MNITFNIPPVAEAMRAEIQAKIDHLNKPKGSLGMLEETALSICMIQHTLEPRLNHPCHILLGGDHGIEREGVSVSPREVTWQQMLNFTRGGGGVNMFCRQHGFDLRIVDVGVDYDLSDQPLIQNRKIARGTNNFRYEAAMNADQYEQALRVGIDLADDCVRSGSNVISIGEMGIANTSPSSVWMHLLGGVPLSECVGAGAGLSKPGVSRKLTILSESIERFTRVHPDADTDTIISYFGGYEMVTAIGVMLRGAERGCILLIDGFIMTACALAAVHLHPAVRPYMIFAHCGDEGGHRRMLSLLGARGLLQLGLRLGEGTGALCSYPIIESSVRMVNEMNNFDTAHITKYF